MTYRAIIIDDEVWTRETIKEMADWEKLCLELVGEAADGASGLILIREVLPDIVITDIKMPGMDGVELLQQIHDSGYPVQTLVLSGHDRYEYVRDAMKLGAVDYLLKPIDPQELNQQLGVCIRRIAATRSREWQDAFKVGFVAEGWEDTYKAALARIATALQLGDERSIHQGLESMKASILAHEGREANHAVLIGVYYALILPLQEQLKAAEIPLKELLAGWDTSYVFSNDSTVDEMLGHVYRLYAAAITKLNRQLAGADKLDTNAVLKYVKERYAQGLTLQQTAAAFFVSEAYLSKAFKAAFGIGFNQYVTSLRMEKARELILTYNAPARDISELVGYLDQSHFHKTFKRYFGMTPGQLRTGTKIDKKEKPI